MNASATTTDPIIREYAEHQGTRTYPSTAAAIDTQLTQLAGQGFLSGPVSDDAASSAGPGGVAE